MTQNLAQARRNITMRIKERTLVISHVKSKGSSDALNVTKKGHYMSDCLEMKAKEKGNKPLELS